MKIIPAMNFLMLIFYITFWFSLTCSDWTIKLKTYKITLHISINSCVDVGLYCYQRRFLTQKIVRIAIYEQIINTPCLMHSVDTVFPRTLGSVANNNKIINIRNEENKTFLF